MADMAYITDFLTKVEGPRQVRGYVPCNRISDGKGRNYIGAVGVPPCGVQYPATGDPSGFRAMGASGVTVATGCDLGQTDIPTLKAYGLTDEDLLCKRDPYIGLKKIGRPAKTFSPASSADSHGSLHPSIGPCMAAILPAMCGLPTRKTAASLLTTCPKRRRPPSSPAATRRAAAA